MKKLQLFAGLLILVFFIGCKKEKPEANVSLSISHTVDGAALEWNSMIYTNAAGNNYSVSRLVYYLSGISLVGNGTDDFVTSTIHYLDASDPATLSIDLGNVPTGNYTGINFTFGVDEVRNVTGGLENTTENNNMAWPDMMGGGYHHMKFEGYYLDSSQASTGFAMHLGKIGNQIQIRKTINLKLKDDEVINLSMNLNEWFQNPYVYDFNVDGTAIMANDSAMAKLAANGVDIFD